MNVKVIYSHKRLRTVSARMVESDLIVRAPAAISQKRLQSIIEKFKAKFERKKLKESLNKDRPLSEIAAKLNEKYFDGGLKINSIEYSTGQNSLFGCCNYNDARIRISHRLSKMPEWVRDYVIMHEMAHLIEPNHSDAFWKIVYRYKLVERARGYLMATGFEMEDTSQ